MRFEEQFGQPIVAAHAPDEARARAMPAGIVQVELSRDVDRGRLDEDADHPPVTGGHSATSRACTSGASGPIIAPSTAALTRVGSAKADASTSQTASRHASTTASVIEQPVARPQGRHSSYI